MSGDIKRATGPSGLRMENDWASVVIDLKYGEWHVALEPVDSNKVRIFRTGLQALRAATSMLAAQVTFDPARYVE